MTEKLRVGLVGCGRISTRHIEVLKAMEDLDVVAVCDTAPGRAENAAVAASARAYGDHLEMARAERLDVVSILTESGSHARLGAELAPLVGALVVEKPMALTLDDADRLIETCERHGTRLFVVKQNRFNPAIVRLREALDAGRFGKLVMGTVRVRWCRTQQYYDQDTWRGTWKDDGGVFTNQASHHVDLLQWLLGPVESVMAYTSSRLVAIETEDTGVAIMRFLNGALGVVEATTATRPRDLEGSISLLGERGSVVVGGFAVNRVDTWNFAEPESGDTEAAGAATAPPNVYGFGHYAFYRDALECISSGRRAMLDGIEGRKSLELINAIYESAATHAEVRLRYVPRGVRLGRQ
ncbi:MAG: Gfo/Idh/MocA family oxidoreductase [Candidatus Eisenbacteria bacterium]|nr:Gfo/Idh/MocA family oxidoreductase [Candidatus Eisenbacteria bacterium]